MAKAAKVILTVRVRPEIKKSMERIAEADSRTLSQEVELALGEWLAEKKARK
jgi:predicted transcriptional regulator